MAKPEISPRSPEFKQPATERDREALPTPEQPREMEIFSEETALHDDAPFEMADLAPLKQVRMTPSVKSEIRKKIESVMTEDLADFYRAMNEQERAAFKAAGYQTAEQIESLITQTKVKTKKIFQLLFGWLKMIPGINKLFLEQEAKIKTDKILNLRK